MSQIEIKTSALQKILELLYLSPREQTSPPWRHLELGGGNAGALPQIEKGELDPREAYRSLFETLDHLHDRLGPRGTFLLNDVDEKSVRYASSLLREYCREKGWNEIRIEEFPADVRHGLLPRVVTVHFKYPPEELFGFVTGQDVKFSAEGLELLKRIASRSELGLTFISDLNYQIEELGDCELQIARLGVQVPDYESGDKKPSKTKPRAYQVLMRPRVESGVKVDSSLPAEASEQLVPVK